MQADVVRQRPSGGTPDARGLRSPSRVRSSAPHALSRAGQWPLRRGFVWFLARLAHKDVEGFRIDAVLLGGEIVTCGRPLQRSSETLHLLFGHSRLMANRSKITLKLVDPLC